MVISLKNGKTLQGSYVYLSTRKLLFIPCKSEELISPTNITEPGAGAD